jgi:hypothetical protein
MLNMTSIESVLLVCTTEVIGIICIFLAKHYNLIPTEEVLYLAMYPSMIVGVGRDKMIEVLCEWNVVKEGRKTAAEFTSSGTHLQPKKSSVVVWSTTKYALNIFELSLK